MLEKDYLEKQAATLRAVASALEKTSIQIEGLSSFSSPIESLLELGTDLALALAEIFRNPRGTRGRGNNPELKFSSRFSDPLGNPLQTKVYKKPKFWAENPTMVNAMHHLASFFVLVRKNDPSAMAYMAKHLGEIPLYLSRRQPSAEEQRKQKAKRASPSQASYHRRQRSKRSTSKYNP